jgi:sterol desaturase/sphingolipid hydroxylase (fatty acid hydroxylase superfamily)
VTPGAEVIVVAYVALLLLELRWPLRPRVESKARRTARNLGFAALSGATVWFVERPCVAPLAQWVEREGFGVLPRLGASGWLATALALVLLDYSLYGWHVLTHRWPPLWRFHRVHHADLDLDASTALRFHLGEIALSVPWRAAQVVVIGVRPHALELWQILLLAEIGFHHANVRLPLGLERRLCALIVTPRLHGIHHSIVQDERDANWSSGLTLWDRLHGTLRLDVPQDRITVGVPELREPSGVGFAAMLALPLRMSGRATPRLAREEPLPASRELAP